MYTCEVVVVRTDWEVRVHSAVGINGTVGPGTYVYDSLSGPRLAPQVDLLLLHVLKAPLVEQNPDHRLREERDAVSPGSKT